jgi:hypothetical protein
MTALDFSVVGARAEAFSASPQLALRLRVEESTGAEVYAIALRVQIMIEPQRRRYEQAEASRLVDLFGHPERYGETLRPMLWTHVGQMVVGFTGSTEVDLTIPCSYDFEVAANKYLSSLDDGEVPLNLLFSGTVLVHGPGGVASGLVPWNCEARYRLPVSVWRATMDAHFPNSAWIRVDRETFDELCRYKAAQGLPTWGAAFGRLLDAAIAQKAGR